MCEFKDAALLALAKDKNDNISVYFVKVDNEALQKLRGSFESGFNYFMGLSHNDFEIAERCEKDECFVQKYRLPDILIDAIRNPLSMPPIKNKDFEKYNVKALFMGELYEEDNTEHCTAVFKKLTPSLYASTGRFWLIFSNDVYSELDKNIIGIPDKSHAVFHKDKLYFSSFQTANQIFGLSDLYRICSSNDLKTFSSFVSLVGEISLDEFANTRIRKLLAIIVDSEILSNFSGMQIAQLAAEQDINIKLDAQEHVEINLDDKDDAMLILNFLAENTFLTTFNKKKATTSRKKVRED